MGNPPKKKKLYEKPKRLWNTARIEEEKALREEFGLKNARELWKMQTLLRRIRREARRLLSEKGASLEKRGEQLLSRVKRFLLRTAEVTLDDILTLTSRDILARRLQSIVFKKHMARSMTQARQFIAHGHVSVNGKKVSSPSYLVSFNEEDAVGWFGKPIEIEIVKEIEVVKEAAEPKTVEEAVVEEKKAEEKKVE
ncbi:MAG: 30S ribosomal protein S4 [Candidatus Micrarchaeota archaeon]